MNSVLKCKVFEGVFRSQAYLSECLVTQEVVVRADPLCLDLESLVQPVPVFLRALLALGWPLLGTVFDLLKESVGDPRLEKYVLVKESKLVPEVSSDDFLDDSHVWQSLASLLEHNFELLRTEATVV